MKRLNEIRVLEEVMLDKDLILDDMKTKRSQLEDSVADLYEKY
jgi:hypothetical protein